MNRSLCFFSIILLFSASFLTAQEHQVSNSGTREMRRRALVLDIDARVLEGNNVLWSATDRKTTISGNPVTIQLNGSNLLVAVQFTPYIRRSGNVLVAQVQIWLNDPEKGVSHQTSFQTIPMEFNEPIYFFPLGQSEESSSIEIILTVKPYRETSPEAISETNNDE
ncbi:MAG: hypothetical protein FWB86_09565 [Treponema sp.]|nr:hypothetical protein [Treponema sp.]MCL2252255.1 hypothetical protein [Treponema sp.]